MYETFKPGLVMKVYGTVRYVASALYGAVRRQYSVVWYGIIKYISMVLYSRIAPYPVETGQGADRLAVHVHCRADYRPSLAGLDQPFCCASVRIFRPTGRDSFWLQPESPSAMERPTASSARLPEPFSSLDDIVTSVFKIVSQPDCASARSFLLSDDYTSSASVIASAHALRSAAVQLSINTCFHPKTAGAALSQGFFDTESTTQHALFPAFTCGNNLEVGVFVKRGAGVSSKAYARDVEGEQQSANDANLPTEVFWNDNAHQLRIGRYVFNSSTGAALFIQSLAVGGVDADVLVSGFLLCVGSGLSMTRLSLVCEKRAWDRATKVPNLSFLDGSADVTAIAGSIITMVYKIDRRLCPVCGSFSGDLCQECRLAVKPFQLPGECVGKAWAFAFDSFNRQRFADAGARSGEYPVFNDRSESRDSVSRGLHMSPQLMSRYNYNFKKSHTPDATPRARAIVELLKSQGLSLCFQEAPDYWMLKSRSTAPTLGPRSADLIPQVRVDELASNSQLFSPESDGSEGFHLPVGVAGSRTATESETLSSGVLDRASGGGGDSFWGHSELNVVGFETPDIDITGDNPVEEFESDQTMLDRLISTAK